MGNRKKIKKPKSNQPKFETRQEAERHKTPSLLESKIVLTEGLLKILNQDEVKRVIEWFALTHNSFSSLYLEETTIDDIIIKIAGKDYLINRRKSIKASLVISFIALIFMLIYIFLVPEEAVKNLINSTPNLLIYPILIAMIIGMGIKVFTHTYVFFRTWLIDPPIIRRLRKLNTLVDSGIITVILILTIEITGGRLYASYFIKTYALPVIEDTLPVIKNFISDYSLSIILKVLDWIIAGIVGHYSVLTLQKVIPVKVKEAKT